MHPYALHDRCVQRLRGLEIPRPFHLDVFAASVAERRRRALRILPLPGLDGSDGLSGAWVATDTADYVLIDADASPWHRNMIGLHEIGHVLCGHEREDGGLGELAEDLLPCLSNVTIRRILGRHGCSSSDEQEAELMACLILAGLPVPAFGGAWQAASDLASLRALRVCGVTWRRRPRRGGGSLEVARRPPSLSAIRASASSAGPPRSAMRRWPCAATSPLTLPRSAAAGSPRGD